MLQEPHDHAADDVDKKNNQACDGVAFDELRGTVHGAEEVGLLRNLFAALLRGLLVDYAGIEIRINGHLLAWHRIESESGGHFGDAARTFGNHRKVDDHQNAEDNNTHQVIAGNHKLSECLNHLACSIGALMAIDQHHAGRGHVQCQPKHCGEKDDGGEGREVQRPFHADRDHDHDQPNQNIEGKEEVEQQGWQRQDQHGHDEQNEHGDPQTAGVELGQSLS